MEFPFLGATLCACALYWEVQSQITLPENRPLPRDGGVYQIRGMSFCFAPRRNNFILHECFYSCNFYIAPRILQYDRGLALPIGGPLPGDGGRLSPTPCLRLHTNNTANRKRRYATQADNGRRPRETKSRNKGRNRCQENGLIGLLVGEQL